MHQSHCHIAVKGQSTNQSNVGNGTTPSAFLPDLFSAPLAHWPCAIVVIRALNCLAIGQLYRFSIYMFSVLIFSFDAVTKIICYLPL